MKEVPKEEIVVKNIMLDEDINKAIQNQVLMKWIEMFENDYFFFNFFNNFYYRNTWISLYEKITKYEKQKD